MWSDGGDDDGEVGVVQARRPSPSSGPCRAGSIANSAVQAGSRPSLLSRSAATAAIVRLIAG